MQIAGKHTIRVFDRKNNLIHEDSQWNTITSKGRERILDIWSHNIAGNPDRKLYGFEKVDSNPVETPYGARRFTFFDIGTMLDPRDSSGSRNLNGYDYILTGSGKYTEEEVDRVFNLDNDHSFDSNSGRGNNSDQFECWHCVDMARIDTEETFTVDTASGNQTINLAGSNLKYDYNSDKRHALTVWNASKTTAYTINTDYTFDRVSGTVTIIAGSNIPDTSEIIIEYKWHDVSLFEDGFAGMYMKSWPHYYQGVMGCYRSVMGLGRMSATGGESWERSSFPWHGKPQDPYCNWRSDDSDWYLMPQIMDAFSHNDGNHWYVTYPYILNNPTNFAFIASFNYYGYNIQQMHFLKPVFNPQTPRVLALGTGTSSPDISDTALENEVLRLDVLHTGRPSDGIGKWTAYLDYDEYSGIQFGEVGLFHGDTWKASEEPGWTYVAPIRKELCNELFSRTVYSQPWTKTDDQRVELTYEIRLV